MGLCGNFSEEKSNLWRTIASYRGHITLMSTFEEVKRANSWWYYLTGPSEEETRISLDYAKDLYRVEQFENKYREWLGKLYKAVQKMSLRCTDCQHLWHHAECLDIINYSWVLKRDNLNAIDRKMKKYRIFFTRVVHELLLLQIPVMDKPFLNFMIIIVTFHWEHFKLSVYRAKI